MLLVVSTILKIAFVLAVLLGIAPLLVWLERRQSAMMQDRVGPVRAGIPLTGGMWNVVLGAGVLSFVGAWLLDWNVALVLEAFRIGPPLASGTVLASFIPIFGPIGQLALIDNAWTFDLVAVLSLLGELVGLGIAGAALWLKDQMSVADFVRGPLAMGARAFAFVAAAFGALALVGAAFFVWKYGPTGHSESGMSAAWYVLIAIAAGVVSVAHLAIAWIVKNSVDKRGELVVFGLIHPLVDVIKMLWKEDFTPPGADKFLYSIAPIIAMLPSLATFAVIPFGTDLHWGPAGDAFKWLFTAIPEGAAVDGRTIPLQVANLNVGILYIFAIAGTGIVGAAIAGYSSDNKYSLLGGLRAASQMVSYEVTLGLTLVGCFMIYGSLLLNDMVAWQQHHVWGFVVQPLALILFFFASIAEMKRVPFDAPEGESEIVAGYFLEYAGMKFGMFMAGEFIEHITSSALIVTLFFGGYDIPLLHSDGFHFGDLIGYDVRLPHLAVVALGVVAFLLKTSVIILLQLSVRWTLPRFRYDQIMKLCWKTILPLSLANILITGIAILLFE